MLVIGGVVSWIMVDGLVGEALAIAFIGLGLGGALLLVFFEIGLSEERALAEDEQHGRPSQRAAPRQN